MLLMSNQTPSQAGPKINHRMDWRGLESKRSFG
jgi:hypothetical protein